MKRVYSSFSLLLFSAISFAQCGGSCPPGALTTLPAVTTYRFDLPSHLPTGIYFIKVTGADGPPLVARVLKN